MSVGCRKIDIELNDTPAGNQYRFSITGFWYRFLGSVSWDLRYEKYYIIRYNMRAAAMLTFDKCLYLRGGQRLTTARRLSAFMSSRALATTTTSS